MCTIGGYVQVKDIDGLTKYYSQIQKDINKVNNLEAGTYKLNKNMSVKELSLLFYHTLILKSIGK